MQIFVHVHLMIESLPIHFHINDTQFLRPSDHYFELNRVNHVFSLLRAHAIKSAHSSVCYVNAVSAQMVSIQSNRCKFIVCG